MSPTAAELMATRESIQSMSSAEIGWCISLLRLVWERGCIDDGWVIVMILLRQSLMVREMSA